MSKNLKCDRTDKIEKSKVRITDSRQTPDLVEAFTNDNGGLNQLYRTKNLQLHVYYNFL